MMALLTRKNSEGCAKRYLRTTNRITVLKVQSFRIIKIMFQNMRSSIVQQIFNIIVKDKLDEEMR